MLLNMICYVCCNAGVMIVMWEFSYLKCQMNTVNWSWQNRDRWIFHLIFMNLSS